MFKLMGAALRITAVTKVAEPKERRTIRKALLLPEKPYILAINNPSEAMIPKKCMPFTASLNGAQSCVPHVLTAEYEVMSAPAKGTYRETVNVMRMIPHFRPQAH